jgi:hypothetical protein
MGTHRLADIVPCRRRNLIHLPCTQSSMVCELDRAFAESSELAMGGHLGCSLRPDGNCGVACVEDATQQLPPHRPTLVLCAALVQFALGMDFLQPTSAGHSLCRPGSAVGRDFFDRLEFQKNEYYGRVAFGTVPRLDCICELFKPGFLAAQLKSTSIPHRRVFEHSASQILRDILHSRL